MGAAHFIVLERRIAGLETNMDGKELSRHLDTLDDVARELGVRPLSEFFSADPGEVRELLEDEDLDASAVELPPLQQFPARDGLATVRALAAHPAGRVDGVAEDLRECERILSAAEQHGVGWHLEIDF